MFWTDTPRRGTSIGGGRGVEGIDIPAPPLLIMAIKSSFPQLPSYNFPHTTLLRPLAFDPAHIIVAEEAV